MKESTDNGAAQGFHRACDNKGPSVTVVKSAGGHVFGAVTDKSWGGGARWIQSSVGFLFCLSCAGAPDRAQQFGITSQQYAVYQNPSYGPSFGGGHDLHISNTPGASGSYTTAGHSYASRGSETYMAGTRVFRVIDYEVFIISA